jgi:hypothetical protein
VKLLIPASSKATISTRPKPAQKSDCEVSNMLKRILIHYFAVVNILKFLKYK